MNVFQFIELFKTTPYWADMIATVEDSPWHREANVAVHTEMIIDQYMANFAPHRTEQEIKIALISILFHDTGKPSAEEVLDKKDGTGQYRRYAGHEQDSAVTFTECYVKMPELQGLLNEKEARAVRWTIEHHLPYGMTDKIKRQGLRTATALTFEEIGITDRTFFDVLRSDCWGRISDDHDQKKQNVEDWITEFQLIMPLARPVNDGAAVMMLLIGASGSGKSTFRSMFSHATVISADEMKIAFWRKHLICPDAIYPDAPTEYELAWKYCTMEPESSKAFEKFFKEESAKLVKKVAAAGGQVIIDIVNSSKKRRAPFVELAKQNGMEVVAVEFWNTFETLSARQQTRGDKRVPDSSIKQQMYATTCAWLGVEVQHVMVRVGQ